MKFIFAIVLFLVINSIPYSGYTQNEVEIGGNKYILHKVSKSETVFSICQKYHVSQKELLEANPGLMGVLQSGTTVKVPTGKLAAESKKPEVKTPNETQTDFYFHKVAKKQTIFSIARQYGISANDLIRFNPELTNGLVAGQVLKIPVSITNTVANSDSRSESVSPEQGNLSEYLFHSVVSGETLFGLENIYNITHEQMLRLNPALQDGLKTGMKLKILKNVSAQPVELEIDPKLYTKYQVGKGETLFSLSNRFGIEVEELKKANPSLFSRSVESGETILIPKKQSASKSDLSAEQHVVSEFTEPANAGGCVPVQGLNSQKYKAGLLLPFYLPAFDKLNSAGLIKSNIFSKIIINHQVDTVNTDTTVVASGVNIDQKALGFLQFYEGALLAIDSLQKTGMNIELDVFDASNQQSINNLLQLEEFRDLNLIIGPVYPELQETVASFAAKNRIAMVSPLSASGNFEHNNSWYFKVNPTKEFQSEQTALYIANEFANTNFFLLQFSDNPISNDASLARITKQKLLDVSAKGKFHEYNFQLQGVNDIKSLLDDNKENVFMIPSENEAQVSIAVTNLTALAEHYNIVLIGTPSLTKLKSIQIENYHRIRLRYLSPYFVNYERPLVRRFIGQYRLYFSSEPTPFSYQGYDVIYYFLSAMQRFGKDFRGCLPDYSMELTQMDFNFRKVMPMGGFVNNSLFITAYERNFDILSYGVFPVPFNVTK